MQLPDGCLLGCHVSISGGINKAPGRAGELGCTTAQIFVSSNRQWAIRELRDDEGEQFVEAASEIPGGVHAHACYLINLANPEAEKREKSIDTLSRELERCERLDIPYLVLHPGSHVGEGEEDGLKRIRDGLNAVHDRVGNIDSTLLVENMAGQGSALPYRFEQMRTIRESVDDPDRLGYCLDTCHLHAAGYDISSEDGYEQAMRKLDNVLDRDRIELLHLNDSRGEAGSRVDRHQHIGDGTVGEAGFRCLMNDDRWTSVPKVLETPVDDDWREDYGRNMETLVGYMT